MIEGGGTDRERIAHHMFAEDGVIRRLSQISTPPLFRSEFASPSDEGLAPCVVAWGTDQGRGTREFTLRGSNCGFEPDDFQRRRKINDPIMYK
jgi:hypothetical protein